MSSTRTPKDVPLSVQLESFAYSGFTMAWSTSTDYVLVDERALCTGPVLSFQALRRRLRGASSRSADEGAPPGGWPPIDVVSQSCRAAAICCRLPCLRCGLPPFTVCNATRGVIEATGTESDRFTFPSLLFVFCLRYHT